MNTRELQAEIDALCRQVAALNFTIAQRDAQLAELKRQIWACLDTVRAAHCSVEQLQRIAVGAPKPEVG